MISRSGAAGSAGGIAERCAGEVERDLLRIGADEQDEHEPHRHDSGRGEPGDDERVEVEILAGEERPEDERAERRAEERAEQDERDAARPASGGYMSAAAALASRTVPLAVPTSANPAMTRTAESSAQPSAVTQTAEDSRAAAGREDGDPAQAVHRPPGRQRRHGPRGEEDRRARGRGFPRSR